MSNVDLQSFMIDANHQMLMITVFGPNHNNAQYFVLMADGVPFFVIQGKKMIAANRALNTPEDRHAAYIMFHNLGMLDDENQYTPMVRWHLQNDQPYVFERSKTDNRLY